MMVSHDASEPELLRAFREGRDEAAFRELVRRHLGMVTGVALRRTGDRGVAEEIAQNVFVKFARKAPTLDPRSVVGAWLHRVAAHEAIDYNRREYRRRRGMQEFREASTATTSSMSDPAIDDGLLADLDDALASLSRREREVVMLRFSSDMSFRAIGLRQERSEDAARKAVGRALDKLASILGRHRRRAVPSTTVAMALSTAFDSSAAVAPAFVAAVTHAALASSTTLSSAAFAFAVKTKAIPLAAIATVLFATSFVAGRHSAAGFQRRWAEQAARSEFHRQALAAEVEGLRGSSGPGFAATPTAPGRTVAEIIGAAADQIRAAAASSAAHYRTRLILEELEPGDYRDAVEHLESLRHEDRVYERIGSLLAGLWACEDGEAALEWAQLHLDPATAALGNVLEGWSRHDPENAYKHYRAMARDGESGVPLTSFRWLPKGLFAGWCQHHPAGAIAAFQEVAVEDEEGAAFGIAEAVAESPDPGPILAALGTMPHTRSRERLIHRIAGAWAREEPHAAAAWVDALPMPTARARLMAKGEVAEEWMRHDPSDAVGIGAWFLSGAPRDMQEDLADIVAREIIGRRDGARMTD